MSAPFNSEFIDWNVPLT